MGKGVAAVTAACEGVALRGRGGEELKHLQQQLLHEQQLLLHL